MPSYQSPRGNSFLGVNLQISANWINHENSSLFLHVNPWIGIAGMLDNTIQSSQMALIKLILNPENIYSARNLSGTRDLRHVQGTVALFFHSK